MSDRRLLASNGRTADIALKGHVDADAFVTPEPRRLTRNAWLLRAPGGEADRECLWGDPFDAIETRGAFVFGRAVKDGYVGWLPVEALGAPSEASHMVAVRTTWAYRAPDFKTGPWLALHMTSRVAVTSVENGWAALEDGELFVPERHLRPVDHPLEQIAAARAFLGTPYVWAGNSGFGLDCSGLVQVTMNAAGCTCAGDSDLQEEMPGQNLSPEDELLPGDLMFWDGHVAIATGQGTLIHANAHHMAVVEEPVDAAIGRIAASETGPVTSRLRPERRPLFGTRG